MLKHNSIKKWAGVAMLTLLVGACTDDFDEINTNPNSPVDVPAANILASVMYGTANSYAGGYNYGHLACWSQMFAEVQYIGTDRYDDGSNDGYWNTPYLRLKDIQIVQLKATEAGFANMNAIADIMAVIIYHVLTDNFGDIPYSEALMADAAEPIIKPVYDTQASIYADLVLRLTTAAATLTAGTMDDDDINAITKIDAIYGGDIAAWAKFANTLALRILIRTAGTSAAATSGAAFAAIAAGNIFSSNADDAKLNFLDDKNWWHPLYARNFARNDYGMSKRMIDVLNAGSDPRTPFYARLRTLDDTYVGHDNGTLNDPNIPDVSMIGDPYGYTATAPWIFMSYTETEFILAEAVTLGWISGDAESHYDAGIQASMDAVGVAAADATTFITAAGAANAENIATQKWLAIYPNGIEAYAELRRTGYPVLNIPPATNYPGQGLPWRLGYPYVEETYNQDNFNLVIVGITDRMYGKKVWWDTRTRDGVTGN